MPNYKKRRKPTNQVDPTLLSLVRDAYINRSSRPKLEDLATEFKVSRRTIAGLSSKEGWVELRKAKELGKEIGAKVALRAQKEKINDLEALDGVISDLFAQVSVTDAKSKEGVANAMANLIKIKRDLFPPTIRDLARMAVNNGFSAADFIREIKAQWAESEAEEAQRRAG